MLVHRQWFPCNLKDANEHNGFMSVFCTDSVADWVSKWRIRVGSKSGLLLPHKHMIAGSEGFVYPLWLIKIYKQKLVWELALG